MQTPINDDPEKDGMPTVTFTRKVRPQVALRFQTLPGYALQWFGSVTAYTWPKVLAYTLYTTMVVLVFKLSCDDKKESDDPRCVFAHKKLRIELMVELWMAFTAFLFQSFVNAGISSFRATLGAVRSIQGRFNEVSLLLHSHANSRSADECLIIARRFLLALPYIMYSGKRFGGEQGRDCLQQAKAILEPQEFAILMERKESDRPYVILTWLSMITQRSIQKGHLADIGGALALQLPRAIERLRGTFGGLVDSLDDPILPFPFANLIILNVYLVSLLIPFISLEMLGYYVIPAAMIYFWFLDGMVTFVFFAHEPFLGMAGMFGGDKQPLIDIDRALLGMVEAVPRRFPEAIIQLPLSVSDIVKEKES